MSVNQSSQPSATQSLALMPEGEILQSPAPRREVPSEVVSQALQPMIVELSPLPPITPQVVSSNPTTQIQELVLPTISSPTTIAPTPVFITTPVLHPISELASNPLPITRQELEQSMTTAINSSVSCSTLLSTWKQTPQRNATKAIKLFFSLYIQALRRSEMNNPINALRSAFTLYAVELQLPESSPVRERLNKILAIMEEISNIPGAQIFCLRIASAFVKSSSITEDIDTHLARFLFLVDHQTNALQNILIGGSQNNAEPSLQEQLDSIRTTTCSFMQAVCIRLHPYRFATAAAQVQETSILNARLLHVNTYVHCIAELLIRPNGSLNRALLADAQSSLVRSPASGFDTYLTEILNKFHLDDPENTLNNAFDRNAIIDPNSEGAKVIRIQLCLSQNTPITRAHVQKVRFASLLSRWTQSTTADCYTYVLSAAQRKSVPHIVLDQQRELLERGFVTYTINGQPYTFQGSNTLFHYFLNDPIPEGNSVEICNKFFNNQHLGTALSLFRSDGESDVQLKERIALAISTARTSRCSFATLFQALKATSPAATDATVQNAYDIVAAGFEMPLSRIFDNTIAGPIFPPFISTNTQQNAQYNEYFCVLMRALHELLPLLTSDEVAIQTARQRIEQVVQAAGIPRFMDASRSELIYNVLHFPPQLAPLATWRFFAEPSHDLNDRELHWQLYIQEGTEYTTLKVTAANFGVELLILFSSLLDAMEQPLLATTMRSMDIATLTSQFEASQASVMVLPNRNVPLLPYNFLLGHNHDAYWSVVSGIPHSSEFYFPESSTDGIEAIGHIVTMAANLRQTQVPMTATEGIESTISIDRYLHMTIPAHTCLFTPHTIASSIPTGSAFPQWAEQRLNEFNALPLTQCPTTISSIRNWLSRILENYASIIEQFNPESVNCRNMTLRMYIEMVATRYRSVELHNEFDTLCLQGLHIDQPNIVSAACIQYGDTNFTTLTGMPRAFCLFPCIRTQTWANFDVAKDWSLVRRHPLPYCKIMHPNSSTSGRVEMYRQHVIAVRHQVKQQHTPLRQRFNTAWDAFQTQRMQLEASENIIFQELLALSFDQLEIRLRTMFAPTSSISDTLRSCLTQLQSMITVKGEYEEQIQDVCQRQHLSAQQYATLFVTTVDAEARHFSERSDAFFTMDSARFVTLLREGNEIRE